MNLPTINNEVDHLLDVKKFHNEAIAPLRGKPKGCSRSEVDVFEQSVGFALPLAYRQYLLWMGKDYDGIFTGCDWFIRHVPGNKAMLPELLADNKVEYVLPKNFLVFFTHQGYMAAWFLLPKVSENPPCYFYSEGKMAEPTIEGLFTDVLLNDMRGLADFLR